MCASLHPSFGWYMLLVRLNPWSDGSGGGAADCTCVNSMVIATVVKANKHLKKKVYIFER